MRWNSDREVEQRLIKWLIGVAVVLAVIAALIEWNGRRKAKPGTSPMPAVVAPPAPATTPAPPPPAPVVERAPPPLPTPAEEAEDAERQASWRAAREEAIRVQKRLRAEEAARRAAPELDANERCIGGQKFKRVDNGWVQVGTC